MTNIDTSRSYLIVAHWENGTSSNYGPYDPTHWDKFSCLEEMIDSVGQQLKELSPKTHEQLIGFEVISYWAEIHLFRLHR